MDILEIRTRKREEILDITAEVDRAVAASGRREGLCTVFVPHTTAAVTINENADPDVQHDLLKKLESLIPQREAFYQHDEGNSDSHLKASLVGNTITVSGVNGVVEEVRLACTILTDQDGVTNIEEFRNGTHPRGTVLRYFAEGANSGIFTTVFAFANPNAHLSFRFAMFPALSAQLPVLVTDRPCPSVESVPPCTLGLARPDWTLPCSVQAKLTVTGVLFQLLLFAAGVRVPVISGLVLSILIVTVVGAPTLPAKSVQVPLTSVPAVSFVRV